MAETESVLGFGVAGVAWHHGGCGSVSLAPVSVVPVSKSAVKFLKWRRY